MELLNQFVSRWQQAWTTQSDSAPGRAGFCPDAATSSRLRCAVAVLVWMQVAAFTWQTLAQDTRPPAQLPPPVASASEVPTAESIEAMRQSAVDSKELTDEARRRIEERCKVALEELKRAAEFGQEALRLKALSDDLPTRLQQLQALLKELQAVEMPDFTSLSLTDLEAAALARDQSIKELKATLARIATESTTRKTRRPEIVAALLQKPEALAELQKQIGTPPPPDEPPLETSLRVAEQRIRKQLLESEIPLLQNERTLYEAEDKSGLQQLERDVRTQELAVAEKELEEINRQLKQLRLEETRQALRKAQDEYIEAEPLLKTYASESRLFAELALQLTVPTETATTLLGKARTRLEGLQQQFDSTRQKVDSIGLTHAVGARLRRQRSELPNVYRREQNISERRSIIEKHQFLLFEAEDLRASLAKRDDLVAQIMKDAPDDQTEDERDRLEAAARDILDRRASYLDQLIYSYKLYLDTLTDLDETEQLLVRLTHTYLDYINERVLWVRSNPIIFQSQQVEELSMAEQVGYLDDTDLWCFEADRWLDALRLLAADAQGSPVLHVVAVLAILVLVVTRRRLRNELKEAGTAAQRGMCTSYVITLRALWLSCILSSFWPALFAFLGWRFQAAAGSSEFPRALGFSLLVMAAVYLPINLLRVICRNGGLAECHFDWTDTTITIYRRRLPRLIVLLLPTVFLSTLLYSLDLEHRQDIPERIAFVFAALIVAVFLRRILRPDQGILSYYLATHRDRWLDQMTPVWYWGSVLLPVGLAVLAAVGFYYTAQQLVLRLFMTVLFAFGLQLFRSMLQRLLIVRRRQLTIERARERRRAQLAAQETREAPAEGQASLNPSSIVPPEELRADVELNTQQSRRLLNLILLGTSLIGIWGIWIDVLPALRILDHWPLWTTKVEVSVDQPVAGATTTVATMPRPLATEIKPAAAPQTMEVVKAVTPRDLALAIIIVVMTFGCARNIPGLMEMWILQRLPFDQSVRYAITSLTRYCIVLLGVILSFNAISVGWSKVQWLATALTFGLAFGLQEIFANFVAGLILLFERPIRIGDVVTVDDVSGVVSRIRMRATTITNWDRKEYVIPNREFITGRMLNWTLTDKVNRIVINVGVAYGSNVMQAKALLLKVCQEHPLLLDDPPAMVTFEGFGDNSLNLVVRCFLPDLDNRLKVIDALHTSIESAFRNDGIEISFPQRDLHLRSIDRSILRAFGAGRESAGPELPEGIGP